MSNKCPKCGELLPEGASFCLHCFSTINEKYPPQSVVGNRKKRFIIIAGTAIVFVSLLTTAVTVIAGKQPELSVMSTTVASVTEERVSTKSETQKTTESVTQQTTAKTTASTTERTTTAKTTEKLTAESTSKEEESTSETTEKKTTTKKATEKTTENDAVVIEDGVLKSYPKGRSSSSYTIPYGVKKINKNAFDGNKKLKVLKFSKREDLSCDWSNLFAGLPNLETIYIYAGTSADTEGMQYFGGEIIYYYD